MGKSKTVFFCKECGFESAKWVGQCPGCRLWDTMAEEPAGPKKNVRSSPGGKENHGPELLSAVCTEEDFRTLTGISELDRVLGGGIVKGSLILVGGDPGIGKSTLLLQMCRNLAAQKKKILYVSGEESTKQIKIRAERLGKFSGELLLLSETDLDLIEEVIRKQCPEIVIIDSIQTMFREEVGSSPGSVSQVRETCSALMQIGKKQGISIFIVGHVTKEGVVAGPRVLEHMVDTVLYFEGDGGLSYRFLRGAKNRFGSTNEIGVFEMKETGLEEVKNPSEYMLSGKPEGESGSAVSCTMEGTRPMLIEMQALVCRTNFNMPRRTAAGVDYNRVNLLMAVIEKRLNMRLSDCDAYVNAAGGIRIQEPSIDLALVAVIISSFKNKALAEGTVLFGEVGLTGEVRAVSGAEQRVIEAGKMGFRTCILPKVNQEHLKNNAIKLIGIRNIRELLEYL